MSAQAEAQPDRGRHLVQFYQAEPTALVRNVGAFIDEGMRGGESVVVIATPEHNDAFLAVVAEGGDRDAHIRRMVFLDAQATLDQFMRAGKPDWQRFEEVVGGTIRGLRRANPSSALRAYGEMVGLLWSAGQIEAAVQLENFWNVLLGGDEFTLFCGYPIDVFADDFDVDRMNHVLCAHSHVLPAGDGSAMEIALDRAVRDVLGVQAGDLRRDAEAARTPAWPTIPGVEATILGLRNTRPAQAREILSLARSYYRACA